MATGGKKAAGIGGGYQGASCDIAINGGTVMATGGDSGQDASPGIGSGVSVYTSCRIYAANDVLIKADTSTPPNTEVVHASPTDDIADLLKNKRYVTAEPKVFLVTVAPTVVPGASKVRVYTNYTIEVFTPYVVYSNNIVKVVYTADSGYVFADGKAEYLVERKADKATTTVVIPTEDQPVLKPVDEEIEKPASNDSIVYNGMEQVGITNIDERLILKGGVTKATNVISTNAIFALPTKIVSTAMAVGTNYFWKGETDPVSKTNDLPIAWTLARRPITIMSANATKVWDGETLTAESVEIVAGSYAEGEMFAYTVMGMQTEIGWSTNFYTYSDSVNTKTINYAVTQKYGILTVTDIPLVTLELPEVAGATAQLYAFYTQGGWTATATNEVPSNATVRVIYTAADGKAWEHGVYVWSSELVATSSVQTTPAPAAPTTWSGCESSVALDIDTRTTKRYFDAADILPVWYAAGSEVKVDSTTLIKNAADTNTVSWLPASIGVYDFSQTGDLTGQINYTTPVEVTTNSLEVITGTSVEVTVDGAALPEDGVVASNSVVTATWTATDSGLYFMDGNTTYTQTFEASKAVNPVSEEVTKPEEPKEPKLLLGVVAQRYPWDGKIDVQYWAKNTPTKGYTIIVTVTLPNGTEASETYDCMNSKNTVAFDARAKFGEVQFKKGVKVKASLLQNF